MTPEQREAIRSNAKYLANVRAIDPDEIQHYVEGQPHPATVRQVLREAAPELGLIERPDGTFEPVGEPPIETPPDGVDRLPERLDDRVAERLVEAYGVDWASGESGDRLRERIRALKEDYYRNRPVTYDRDAALGYAIYHLADYYAAVRYLLAELVERRLLPRHLRVVDVGAGVGGPALGLLDGLPEDALVEYHAVEPSDAAADLLESLLDETGRNVHPTVVRTAAEDYDPPACDLLLAANVASELAAPARTLRRYAGSLAPDGSLLLMAPADRETSIGLREVERELTDELTVFSPTVRLWPDREPTDRCWSFDRRPELAVPAVQRQLDEAGGGTGEFVNVDVQFSYATLRPDGAKRIEYRPDPSREAPLDTTGERVSDRIDCVAVKLSPDLGDAHPLYLVGDGSQDTDHFAVLTKATALNEALRTAGYGDLLRFESTLALWNDDEAAYNLVVDDGTVVDRLGPGIPPSAT